MKQKYIVGMSGGVDSSLAALLLKEQGHDVAGVCMAVYDRRSMPSKTKGTGCYGCDHSLDHEAARKVCEQIGIGFRLFDCSEEFARIVLGDFQSEYGRGRTPNPCVICNEMMKFGLLNRKAAAAGIDFDYFATGHYAKVEFDGLKNAFLLKKGKDPKKDQSYFLYRLTHEKLQKIRFPLGDLSKNEVRELARKHGLSVHDKPDSQDFYSGRYADLLNMAPKEGPIVLENGQRLGIHQGFWNYTVGQRKGLGIAYKEPLFVLRLDSRKNEVVVGVETETYTKKCLVSNLSWTYEPPETGRPYTAKIRSAHAGAEAVVTKINAEAMEVSFTQPQKSLTAGQSLVLYDIDTLLGGGQAEPAP